MNLRAGLGASREYEHVVVAGPVGEAGEMRRCCQLAAVSIRRLAGGGAGDQLAFSFFNGIDDVLAAALCVWAARQVFNDEKRHPEPASRVLKQRHRTRSFVVSRKKLELPIRTGWQRNSPGSVP